jgi:hypothetical protein
MVNIKEFPIISIFYASNPDPNIDKMGFHIEFGLKLPSPAAAKSEARGLDMNFHIEECT